MKVALLPGGFKPPHLGHYNMAKYLADFADNVIVRIGSKEREGIGPKLALEIYGVNCQSFIDVGVAGIHRLISQLEEINKYDVLIVCAGMEGALATVVGGLLAQPIIAVPVSVGYGVSKNGFTALNSMLSSCSPGISVMNVDNGYGAAMAALRIIKSFS